MKTLNQNKKGFTIIEVVLVLAIAGLIFLIVFLAVPALQRSQRDTQRRSDMGRFMSQITQYQSNNQGNVPNGSDTAVNNFISQYMKSGGDTFADPTTGVVYEGHGSNGTGGSGSDLGHLYYHRDALCSNNGGLKAGKGDRDVAVRIKLEGGGSFCQDNG